MPYEIDPNNRKCVRKADSKKRVGCTKGSVKKYLAALHANVKDIKESEEFDWVPNEVDLNDHRVLYLIIEDTLKNTNFKIVKDRNIYHIEDEYGDIYFYISERDFNLPFIYHEIKDSIQFLKYEDDNEMLPYYQKLMGLLGPLYKNNTDKLFKPIKESEDEFEWIPNFDVTNTDGGINFIPPIGTKVEVDTEDTETGEKFKLTGEIVSGYPNNVEPGPYFVLKIDGGWQSEYGWGCDGEYDLRKYRWSRESKCWYVYPLNGDKVTVLNTNIKESEEDEFEWARATVKDSFLKYMGKEIMIDIQGLNQDELKKLYSIILPYVQQNDKAMFINDEDEEIYWGDNLQCFKEVVDGSSKKKSISLHCGLEDNEYRPLKGAICCLNSTYEDEPNKENIIPINARELIGGTINESEEWFDEVLSQKPLLKFTDLMVGDVIINIDPNKLNNLGKDDIYFHVDSFKEGTTYRNGYAEKEDFAVISLMKKNPETGNYYGVSRVLPGQVRETINFPKGNNKPIWTLIYRENVLEESEWFEDVVNDPIMLKVEDLEMGDIVIPTCVKDGEYIVMSKGTSVKLLDAPTHWVTLKRHTKANTGGIFVEHDTEIGKNCRFKLVHRENDIIEESEEDEFNWAEDIIANTTEEIDITNDFDLWENKLVEGSVVKITGRWEDMYFEDDIATIVNFEDPLILGDEAGNPLLKFDRVIYEFGNTDEGNHTHCGENETQNIKCECQRRQRNRDEVGKCWWTNLRQMEKIIYLPFEGKQITESEENDFSWVEDITKYLKVGQKFKVKTSAEPLIVQIVRIVKKMDFNRNTIYFSPIKLVNTKYPGVPMNVQRLMTHINNGSWTPINDITESEEDSELFWAEDLLDFNNPINITDKLDIMEELPVGSILQVQGYQDEMEFDMDEVKLIDKAEDKSFDSTYYLFKLKYEKASDSDEMTHCGSGQKNMKICECRGEIGKCWWIELKKQDKVIYYPNRIDLSENKIKKLLTEGRYDAITRKVVRDIMKVVTEGNSDSYNLPLDISGEQEYKQDNLNFNLELEIVRTDEDVQTFEVRTAIADEDDENIVMMTIILGSKFSSQNLEKLFYKLQEDIRHEIEHLTQIGPNRIEDRPTYKGSTANLKTVYGHHKNVIEVPALVHGFYRRAKLEKRPLDEIMTDDLDSEIEKGLLTKKQAQKLLTIWLDYAKKNLPSAIYKEN